MVPVNGKLQGEKSENNTFKWISVNIFEIIANDHLTG